MTQKITTLVFLLGAVTPVLAQVAPEPVVRGLSPVTVTVTRGVEQRAFDTPASVDVIDTSTIRNGGLQVNLSESLARVPGIVALNRQNYAQDIQISSRGFGARSTSMPPSRRRIGNRDAPGRNSPMADIAPSVDPPPFPRMSSITPRRFPAALASETAPPRRSPKSSGTSGIAMTATNPSP